MTFRLAHIIGLVAIVAMPASARKPPRAGAPVPSVTVCEILAHPLKYDGQMLAVRGREVSSREGAWLRGDDCPGVFVTEGYTWPSTIWLALWLPSFPMRHIPPLDFSYDPKLPRKLVRKYKHLGVSDECIEDIFFGLFETRPDWSSAERVYPSGERKFYGFGHLNAAPAQLIVKSQVDVAAIPGCGHSGKKKKDGSRR